MDLQIRVTPNASKNQIVDYVDGLLRVRIKGVPENGQVNDELISFLAKELKTSKSKIDLISGLTSRLKKVHIHGMTEVELMSLLDLFETPEE